MKKKLVFFVTEDWYFISHRLNLALAAQREGYEIFVVTRVQEHRNFLLEKKINVIPVDINRRSMNPLVLIKEAYAVASIYKKIKPDIVHHVALRAVIVGAIAAKLARVKHVVSAITGMGFLFIENNRFPILKKCVKQLFPFLLGKSALIVQNADDQTLLESLGVKSSRICLIPGSGVDVSLYKSTPLPQEAYPIVMFAARLLWDKGIQEFVDAAYKLQNQKVRFVLVGQIDTYNPAAISQANLDKWTAGKVVEYWGHRSKMFEVLCQAEIVCLPSYREGLPKVLIEAMACGRPCITTDVPGCRDVVSPGINGYLVPPQNSSELAKAIALLLENPELRQTMGQNGRLRAVNEFNEEKIIEATLSVYRQLLSHTV
jgi:glycosyltransferase involved in cell wall biosynthesis